MRKLRTFTHTNFHWTAGKCKRAPLVLHRYRFVRHKYLLKTIKWHKLWNNFPVDIPLYEVILENELFLSKRSVFRNRSYKYCPSNKQIMHVHGGIYRHNYKLTTVPPISASSFPWSETATTDSLIRCRALQLPALRAVGRYCWYGTTAGSTIWMSDYHRQ